MIKITKDFLQQHSRSKSFLSLTKKQLKVLGLQYPLKAGWLNNVIGVELSTADVDAFIKAKNIKQINLSEKDRLAEINKLIKSQYKDNKRTYNDSFIFKNIAGVKLNNSKKTNSKDGSMAYLNEILEIYKLYPRKEGKVVGVNRLVKTLKTKEDLAAFNLAVNNYNKLIKHRNTSREYVLMFSTFANGRWEDYVDISELIKSESSGLDFV